MRLLNSRTLKLEEFLSEKVPPYIILSHTWGSEEVSFQEMQHPNEEIRNKLGYTKVQRCCDVAADDGFDHVWIDTCCIDKTSSSELSEAINSMFKWYQEAEVCYAFLSDVPTDLDNTTLDIALRKSRWFTRGWTLQELIAPAHVMFFDDNWKELGTRSSLRDAISATTSIQVNVLLGYNIKKFSIAQRMSWASRRTTTRSEDTAYCLMGLFEVNMPLLYGEGGNAFIRLQEEIIRRSDDHSIFAWQDRTLSRMLATSPNSFQNSADIVQAGSLPAEPVTLTNKGLYFKLPLRRIPEKEEHSKYFISALINGTRLSRKEAQSPDERVPVLYGALLNCHRQGEPESLICVYLEHISTFSEAGSDETRIPSLEMATVNRLGQHLTTVQLQDWSSFQVHSFYVPAGSGRLSRPDRYPRHTFFIQVSALAMKGLQLCESYNEISLDGIPEMEESDDYDSEISLLKFRDSDGDEFVILLQSKSCAVDGYDGQLSAQVYIPSEGKNPKKPLWAFWEEAGTTEPSVVADVLEPEGIIWKQPSGRLMNLVLRRHVLSGTRRILVDFNSDKARLYAKEGRKATIMLRR